MALSLSYDGAFATFSTQASVNSKRNLRRLVDKFKKSSELYRFRTKTGVYEDTVRRLASAKRFNWIEEILEDQKQYINFSKEGFAVRLISLYGKSGMFENARKVFDEMPHRNCPRTVLSFNALLSACVNSKKFDLVHAFFREIPQSLAIEPDLVSYNTVIKALCAAGSFDSAVSVLDAIEEKGLRPDAISFNTLLNGLYSSGRFEEGESVWGEMERRFVSPDIRSYNAKLYGLVQKKRIGEAADLIGEMRSRGIEPDVFSFNLVIGGFVKGDELVAAKKWFADMRKNEVSPNRATFEKLIPFLRKRGDLGFAYELAREVFERKIVLDTSLLQRVVDELVVVSMVEEANALVELGKNNNYCRYQLKLLSIESCLSQEKR